MIDLIISGILDKDIVVFTLNGESQRIDQCSKQIHFSVDATKNNRLYFEQISERDTPIILNILFLPIRGVLNVLTDNSYSWEEDISAFKLSGYIDISLEETTEITYDSALSCDYLYFKIRDNNGKPVIVKGLTLCDEEWVMQNPEEWKILQKKLLDKTEDLI